MSGHVFLYAISHDLGFAPNPFNGVCTLACCKPRIRRAARTGDWIVGMGGTQIKAVGRCIYAMCVNRTMTFDEYWNDPEFQTKRPKRNGSPKKQVGDNVYHRGEGGAWVQEDSVHSLEDGCQCLANTSHDTQTDRILISDRFVYFGSSAPVVPLDALVEIGYAKNPRDFCKRRQTDAEQLVRWLTERVRMHPNLVLGDPIDFASTTKRYSALHKRLV